MKGLTISVCGSCGWRGFPTRLWCPACGNFELSSAVVESGVLAEATVVTTALGRELSGGIGVASVALKQGGTVIARLESNTTGLVGLRSENGVPVALAEAMPRA